MEMGRAIAYIFEDKHWVSRLLPLLVIGIFSLIPIFGLIAVAAGLGYMLHLARNVSQGLPRPLPLWDDWQVKLNDGAYLLLAIMIYNLPALMISICSYSLIAGIGEGFLSSAVSFVFICCTVPVLLIYSMVAWSMLATGATEYIETGDTGRLYRFVHLWDVMRANGNIVFQWMLYAFLANLVISFVAAIPCIGWLAFLLFAYPVQGHLLGQFAHRLNVSKTSKTKKRAASH